MSVYSDIVGNHCLFLLHMKYVPHTHRSQTESDKGIAVLTTMGDVETSLSQQATAIIDLKKKNCLTGANPH